MSFREVLQSAIIPVTTDFNDEFIVEPIAMWVHRVAAEVCPSGVAIAIMVRVASNSDPCYFEWPIFLFDASDGAFCKRFDHGNSLLFNLLTSNIYELPNTTYDNTSKTFGGNLVLMRDLSIFSFETPISNDPSVGVYTATGTTIFPVFSYWEDTVAISTFFMWDPINDIMLMSSNNENQAQIGSYVASTGAERPMKVYTCGFVEQIVAMNPPFAMAFSRNNNVTQFNYISGQIMSVGKLPDFDTARGAGLGERLWTYDRYNHRILFCDQTDLDLDGNETTIIRGVSAIPTAYAIMPPITSRQVQTNRKVPIFTRVIGNAGEPIGATEVLWADEGVGDVAPVAQITDRDGIVIASYDGLSAGGAETITVTTEQSVVDDSVAQGAGAGNDWVPTIHLDFNNQQVNADVSQIIPSVGGTSGQLHWDQVGGYGAFGDQVIKRPVKTSSAELRIQSGDDGILTPSFGGDIIANLTTSDSVEVSGNLWVGVWVYFPTGFDFSTSTDGLRLFQIRDNYWQFTDPDDDILFELRLKHGGGTTHTGYSLAWPNKTVTDTRHDFTAHSSVLLAPDTWHWVQYYVQNETFGPSCKQRLWIDDLIVWELEDDAAQYRETGGGGSLVGFTANESIGVSRASFHRADELRVFRDWEGNAPSDQTCYVGNVVWTKDTTDALPLDENGNRYISKIFAENL